MYEGFAAVYDRLMTGVDYGRWAEYYLRLAARQGIECRRAADCACGTGNLTLALATRGITMTGLDLSTEMLAVAGDKARKRGMTLPFIRQDMRKLLLHRPMDAIFCACDGVNYLTTPDDARVFFSAAYRALRPGGGLFFDVSTEHKLSQTLGDRCLGDDGRDVAYLWINHYERTSRLLQMDLSFFVREADHQYRRFDETHVQRAHTVDELLSWLSGAGFADACAYSEQTFDEPGIADERIHLAAIRPGQE